MGPDMCVRKLVLCPDGLIAAIVGREHFAKVALCTLECFSWSLGADDKWRWYEDLIYYEGKLYAITNSGEPLAFDVGYENTGEPKISAVETVIEGCGYVGVGVMNYLVKSRSGALLMVNRNTEGGRSAYAFEVYKADLRSSGSQWGQVTALGGDEALFVGRLGSWDVRADREGLEGYQISFLDDMVGMWF
ncbi:hypothetical protein VPH35_078289 [Triticum aestivum]|uniref:KIB1-4 beta-propeller domain-containing protein n=1 Tax=Aegilops tauschii TaxID=37682 RepID=R7W9B5_AEGTA|nr:uncharacterized protein LOC120963423 [Aegilops tauschii subsp. strangulata]